MSTLHRPSRVIQPALLIAIMSGAPPVHATYVQQCILDGTITSAPRVVRTYDRGDREAETSTFQMTVRRAAPDGRDDSGCTRTFEGKTIPVSLDTGFTDVKALKQGDAIRIAYRHFDKGSGNVVHFSLAPGKHPLARKF